LSDFFNLNFLNKYTKNTEISNFIKIRPLEAQLLQADGRTDRQTDWHAEASSRLLQLC